MSDKTAGLAAEEQATAASKWFVKEADGQRCKEIQQINVFAATEMSGRTQVSVRIGPDLRTVVGQLWVLGVCQRLAWPQDRVFWTS